GPTPDQDEVPRPAERQEAGRQEAQSPEPAGDQVAAIRAKELPGTRSRRERAPLGPPEPSDEALSTAEGNLIVGRARPAADLLRHRERLFLRRIPWIEIDTAAVDLGQFDAEGPGQAPERRLGDARERGRLGACGLRAAGYQPQGAGTASLYQVVN